MISRYVEPGDKLELVMVEHRAGKSEEITKRVYTSRVNDILSEEQLEIMMPMEKTKLILLMETKQILKAVKIPSGVEWKQM